MNYQIYKLNQRGAALISGLLIMIILSVLGVTVMQSSLLQERMAGNFEQRDVAFEIAEAGLRSGEAWLNATVVVPAFNDSNGRYQPDSSLWKQGDTWWANTGNTNSGQSGSRYYIEYMADIDNTGNASVKAGAVPEDLPGIYRVTSRGINPNARGSVILQTTFVR